MATTARAAGGQFLRDRFALASKECTKRFKNNPVSDAMTKLQFEHAELNYKYQELRNQSAFIQPLQVLSQPATNTAEIVEAETGSNGVTREQLIQEMNWEDLATCASVLATKSYRPPSVSAAMIQSGSIFPQFLFMDKDKNVDAKLDDGAYNTLVTQPYLTHYNWMRTSLVECGRQADSRSRELLTKFPANGLGVETAITPSEWMADFLAVFERAEKFSAIDYPSHREMNDVFYTRKTLKILPTDAPSPTHTRKRDITNYPLDIGYHCVRFASLFTTIVFDPLKNLDMERTVYTDFELLVHFAVRTSRNRIPYEDFLLSPANYLTGDNFLKLLEEIERATNQVMGSFKNGLFFKSDSKHGIRLYRRSQPLTDNDPIKISPAPVPDEIMTGLALDVLNNIKVYETERKCAVFCGLGMVDSRDMRVESPIGRLLNFDGRSVSEFKNLYKELNPSNPEQVNAQLSNRIASFSCVQRVYAMLVTAASAIYANSATKTPTSSQRNSKLQVNFVLGRCMKVDDNTDTVMYASTTEAFPGLLFYTMLAMTTADSVFKKIAPKSASDKEYPGISNPKYFEKRPDRIAFFDTFGRYALQLVTISHSKIDKTLPLNIGCENYGIRWMKPDDLHAIRISTGKQLYEAQSGFVTLLGFNAHWNHHSKWVNRLNVWDYFMDVNGMNSTSTPLATWARNDDEYSYRNFFNLPVMYYRDIYCIDKSVKPPQDAGGRNSILYDMVKRFMETVVPDARAAHNDLPAEDDISRFVAG